jgi:hypothetical protein
VPRIVPTLRWIQAVEGVWEMNGELFHLQAEPESGVLMALNPEGERVNPLRVISRGTKLDD